MPKNTPRLASATVKAIDAWAAFDRARAAAKLDVLTERPAGGKTTAEYAERFKLPYQTAAHQLDALVKAGKMSRHRVKLVAGGKCVPQNVFVPITK